MRFANAELETIRPLPHRLQQFILGDDTGAVPEQVDQQVEHLRFDRNRGVGAAQFPPPHVEDTVVEHPAHPALFLPEW